MTNATPTLIDYKDRDTWLSHRRDGIGASEVPILFGVAPDSWGSIYSLWLEKTGQLEREPFEGEYLEIGTAIEPTIAALYESRTQRQVWKAPSNFCMAQHPRIPRLRCTPDRFVLASDGMPGVGDLQIKNAGWYKADDWQDGPPPAVQIQVQAEIACMQVAWGSAAALIGGNQFRYFDLARNDNFIEEIEAQVEWFLGLVDRREAPPIDGSEATARAIKRLNPADNGAIEQLPPDAVEWLAQWESAKAAKKEHEEAAKAAENQLRAAIGPATFGRLPDGRTLSLKTTERAGYPVGPTSFRTLRIEKKGSRP